MKAVDAFHFNIERARNLVELYSKLIQQKMKHDEIDDLLRSSYVLAVGALDAFVHDSVGERLVPFVRNAVDGDAEVLAPIVRELKSVEPRQMLKWLTLSRPFVQVRKAIEERMGTQSFQHPGKIEEALQLIGRTSIWDSYAKSTKTKVEDVKRQLKQAADRRNQIVHEGDRQKSRLKKHQKRPIHVKDVEEVLDFIEGVGNSLIN